MPDQDDRPRELDYNPPEFANAAAELYNSPSLHISNVVHGRRNLDSRVEYRRTANPDDDNFEIPEQIVLKRWKSRNPGPQNLRFSGFRLSPNVWKSLHFAFGFDVEALCSYSAEEIDEIYIEQTTQPEFIRLHFKRMDGTKVKILTEALGKVKLKKVLERHNDPNFPKRYGTPDLFLYALNSNSHTINHFRFVEVKKPQEPLSRDQINELGFLKNELGVKARVLRLIESQWI